MEQYTCMIVDDEQDAIDYLATLIEENCPQLKIVATETVSETAIKMYFKRLPDLLFLDIEVDEKNGFEILKEIYRDKLKPYTIFVTAFNQYAIEAFKANALDYLLKPCSPDDLKKAVKKFGAAKEKDIQYSQIQKLITGEKQKIRFNTRTGFILLHPDEIVYCEADRNYTKIYTTPKNFFLVSINLAKVERIFSNGDFWRVSRSILVNSSYVYKIERKFKKCIIRFQDEVIKLDASSEMIRKL